MHPEPFEDSRRLTGCNVYFPGTGAALETAAGLPFQGEALARWRDRIDVARKALGWPDDKVVVREHRSGASLAFAAPSDQLYTATEVNEWAWWSAALHGAGAEGFLALHTPGHAAIWDADSALRTLQAAARAEANPALRALQREAARRALPFLPDDDAVSIGAGDGSAVWAMDALPATTAVDWPALHAIPTVLVTGSNGKTTTVRLVAAMTRAHGWHTAHSCTDGVFFDGQTLESGDFSGPTGARTALRQRDAQAAILETARGGILRRGLATCSADAAVVTNIAADHFGEYGVHDLDDLAMVKLTVARAIGDAGLLVLNADDPVLQRRSRTLSCPIGWFALDYDSDELQAHRQAGGATCGVREGALRLHYRGDEHDLGSIAAMPLTLQARAAYNIANIAAAALAAAALGVAADTIAGTLLRFGDARDDNPGRLQRWDFDALQVVLDYAHNPDGLRGLLHAVGADQRAGRLAILLGHAGNREDADLRAVAATAAGFRPELAVLKDSGGYERGRGSGEIATIMRAELLRSGIGEGAIAVRLDEVKAARCALEWARDGDLLVLPIHELAARDRIVSLLDCLQQQKWRPQKPLPEACGDAP
ncbi:MAG: Mur ligase [Luteimonas sp.]|nr:Mur ligase [Luteimonas sp.]